MEESIPKEERKQLRRQRAVERLSPTKVAKADGDAPAELLNAKHHEASNSRPYEPRQMATSTDRLERRKAASIGKISSFRVNAEKRECERRNQDERRRQERVQLRERGEEVESQLQHQIATNWDACANKASAWDTKEALEQQRQCCSDLIKSKTDIIQDYSFYRRLNDDDHASSLKDQGESLQSLRECMESELSEMQQLFNEELEVIEEAFIDDRARLLESNKDELANLVLEKSNIEAHYLKAKQERRGDGKSDIDATRKRGIEEHTELKISLEKQVRELEQKLERAKVTHQLNSDRLDYNLRILTDRNAEAGVIIKKQKKRLVQSKEEFNKSREQYWEAEQRGEKKIQVLSKDCRVLDTRWKSLQTKSRRFEKNDEGKYRALLDMHMDELLALARRIKQYEMQIIGSLGQQRQQPLEDNDIRSVASTSTFESDCEEEALTELRNTIDDATHQTWLELETLLVRYKEILEKKESGSEQMKVILRENGQIQKRMQTIAQSDRSKELICPPTMFLQVGGVGI